eukprot:2579082-Pyramimonas_sp.AAC.1
MKMKAHGPPRARTKERQLSWTSALLPAWFQRCPGQGFRWGPIPAGIFRPVGARPRPPKSIDCGIKWRK